MWQQIDNRSARLKVPGGWVIRYCNSEGNNIGNGVSTSVAMIFINDVVHGWSLTEEEKSNETKT